MVGDEYGQIGAGRVGMNLHKIRRPPDHVATDVGIDDCLLPEGRIDVDAFGIGKDSAGRVGNEDGIAEQRERQIGRFL
jgi:hypothetical protein